MERDDDTRASFAARSSSPIMHNDDPEQVPRVMNSWRGDEPPPTTNRIPEEDDDAEFWKTIDTGMETSLSDIPSAPPTKGPNSTMDEDEDMWNIVNEVEKEALNTAAASVVVASGPLPQDHTQDEDWEDMYV
jgi:hypothetical protein